MLQSEETSDQSDSDSPGEPDKEAVTTTRTRVRRMGISRRGAVGGPPWLARAAPDIPYGAVNPGKTVNHSAFGCVEER